MYRVFLSEFSIPFYLLISITHAAPSYSAMVGSDKQMRMSGSEDDDEELQKVLQVKVVDFCMIHIIRMLKLLPSIFVISRHSFPKFSLKPHRSLQDV